MAKLFTVEPLSFIKNNMYSISLRHITRLLVLRKSRLALARIDADRLCDIGISKTQANQEFKQSFWDAPWRWSD